jgi:hypothetical protein
MQAVAAEAFERVAVLGVDRACCVQGEACDLGAKRSGHGLWIEPEEVASEVGKRWLECSRERLPERSRGAFEDGFGLGIVGTHLLDRRSDSASDLQHQDFDVGRSRLG